jgi:hypothetical protein
MGIKGKDLGLYSMEIKKPGLDLFPRNKFLPGNKIISEKNNLSMAPFRFYTTYPKEYLQGLDMYLSRSAGTRPEFQQKEKSNINLLAEALLKFNKGNKE